MAKKQLTSADPRTTPSAPAESAQPADDAIIPRVEGVNMAGAKAVVVPTTRDIPVTQPVVTGRNIVTGQPVMKERPVKAPAPDYNTGDRLVYTVNQDITGKVMGRRFNLKKGGTVNMNEAEYAVFKPYVTKVNL